MPVTIKKQKRRKGPFSSPDPSEEMSVRASMAPELYRGSTDLRTMLGTQWEPHAPQQPLPRHQHFHPGFMMNHIQHQTQQRPEPSFVYPTLHNLPSLPAPSTILPQMTAPLSNLAMPPPGSQPLHYSDYMFVRPNEFIMANFRHRRSYCPHTVPVHNPCFTGQLPQRQFGEPVRDQQNETPQTDSQRPRVKKRSRDGKEKPGTSDTQPESNPDYKATSRVQENAEVKKHGNEGELVQDKERPKVESVSFWEYLNKIFQEDEFLKKLETRQNKPTPDPPAADPEPDPVPEPHSLLPLMELRAELFDLPWDQHECKPDDGDKTTETTSGMETTSWPGTEFQLQGKSEQEFGMKQSEETLEFCTGISNDFAMLTKMLQDVSDEANVLSEVEGTPKIKCSPEEDLKDTCEESVLEPKKTSEREEVGDQDLATYKANTGMVSLLALKSPGCHDAVETNQSCQKGEEKLVVTYEHQSYPERGCKVKQYADDSESSEKSRDRSPGFENEKNVDQSMEKDSEDATTGVVCKENQAQPKVKQYADDSASSSESEESVKESPESGDETKVNQSAKDSQEVTLANISQQQIHPEQRCRVKQYADDSTYSRETVNQNPGSQNKIEVNSRSKTDSEVVLGNTSKQTQPDQQHKVKQYADDFTYSKETVKKSLVTKEDEIKVGPSSNKDSEDVMLGNISKQNQPDQRHKVKQYADDSTHSKESEEVVKRSPGTTDDMKVGRSSKKHSGEAKLDFISEQNQPDQRHKVKQYVGDSIYSRVSNETVKKSPGTKDEIKFVPNRNKDSGEVNLGNFTNQTQPHKRHKVKPYADDSTYSKESEETVKKSPGTKDNMKVGRSSKKDTGEAKLGVVCEQKQPEQKYKVKQYSDDSSCSRESEELAKKSPGSRNKMKSGPCTQKDSGETKMNQNSSEHQFLDDTVCTFESKERGKKSAGYGDGLHPQMIQQRQTKALKEGNTQMEEANCCKSRGGELAKERSRSRCPVWDEEKISWKQLPTPDEVGTDSKSTKSNEEKVKSKIAKVLAQENTERSSVNVSKTDAETLSHSSARETTNGKKKAEKTAENEKTSSHSGNLHEKQQQHVRCKKQSQRPEEFADNDKRTNPETKGKAGKTSKTKD